MLITAKKMPPRPLSLSLIIWRHIHSALNRIAAAAAVNEFFPFVSLTHSLIYLSHFYVPLFASELFCRI